MIYKLTVAQEKLIPVYREKFRAYGLKTSRCDRELVISETKKFYRACGFDEPEYFYFFDSPMASQIAGNLLSNKNIMDQLRDQLEGQLRDQLGDELGGQLWVQLEGQLRDQLGDQLWVQLEGQLRDQLGDELGGQLWGQLGGQLRDQLEGQLEEQVHNLKWQSIFTGVCENYFLSFYCYIKDVLLPNENTPKLDAFRIISQEVFFWQPYKNAVIFSEPPEYHHWENEKLHCETGPAIKFKDGYSMYALNGVRVPDWLIETPNKEIKSEKVMAIKNAEQRMIAIKYLGLEKFIEKLDHKVLDKQGDYELLGVKLVEDGRYCEYLKMKNPSTSEIHIEGVKPGTTTVAQARSWRLGLDVLSSEAFTA